MLEVGGVLAGFARALARTSRRIMSSFPSGAPTVMIPSAAWPVCLAVIGPAVATKIGGGGSGRVHSRTVSILKNRPSCLTSLPVKSD